MQQRDARPVEGFEEYAVTPDGSVWRVEPYPKLRGRVLPYKLKPGRNGNGYMTVVLVSGKVRSTRKVHRLVAEAFLPPPQKHQTDVAHFDGDRANNAASNLRWASRKENEADKVRHGTRLTGAKHPQSKLCTDEAVAIKQLALSGQTSLQIIADQFGVSRALVTFIRDGRAWPHLQGGRDA